MDKNQRIFIRGSTDHCVLLASYPNIDSDVLNYLEIKNRMLAGVVPEIKPVTLFNRLLFKSPSYLSPK